MRHQRILIVEDQPFQREYLLNLFREQGVVELRAAEEGAEALRWLEQERFDLVVSDLMMPGLDGVQLIQRLATLSQPPLLAIMSSASRPLMGSACMVARAHGITVLEQIAKPARAPVIRRLLEKLVSRQEREVQRHGPAIAAPTREELESGGLYDLLRAQDAVPTTAKQTIGARNATAREAELLHERRRAALMTATRITYDQSGRVIEYGQHIYRASRYTFETSLFSS